MKERDRRGVRREGALGGKEGEEGVGEKKQK
jgi:hypothetical protein